MDRDLESADWIKSAGVWDLPREPDRFYALFVAGTAPRERWAEFKRLPVYRKMPPDLEAAVVALLEAAEAR